MALQVSIEREDEKDSSLNKSFSLMKTSGLKIRKRGAKRMRNTSLNMSMVDKSQNTNISMSSKENTLFLKKNSKSGYYEQVLCLYNNFKRLDLLEEGSL